ncbi:MAG: RloB family protein [Methanomassiliicoccaceae archaeon]|nr:RloB family protein [Methanomassiliicoccaceae archaeon]
MRPVNNNLEIGRKSREKKIKRRFILAFEGYRTEVQYFQGVSDNRPKLRISSLIDVCPLNRDPQHSGLSDPERVLELLEEYINFLKRGKYSADLFINTFISEIIKEKDIQDLGKKIDILIEKAKEKLRPICDGDGYIEDPEKASEVCSDAYTEIFSPEKEVDFKAPEPMDYREERDIVCVIVDRDAELRGEDKCRRFFGRCEENKFRPIMTNPCFELWLLLHFDEALDGVDDKILLRNEKTDGVRYTERKLDEILRTIPAKEGKGYSKDDLDFYDFMDRTDNAIKNEKKFCKGKKCTITKVGSEIGSLIEDMWRSD